MTRALAPLEHLGAALAILLPCLAWTYLAGKDLNFDLLNYHIYAGLAADTGRLEQDFMPASLQSYLTPYALLPLHWMTAANWPDVVVAGILTALQCLNLGLALYLARSLLPGAGREAILARGAAVLFAGLAPVFLIELGTSFYDALASIPAVAAYACMVDARHSWMRRAVLAGVLAGVAVALKFTNFLFVAAMVAGLLLAIRPWRSCVCVVLAFGASALIGLLAVSGYWMGRLWQVFGNPLFPFFNRLFAAPDFPPVDFVHERFRRGMVDQLRLPFDMTLPLKDIYTESTAPDLRFAVLAALLGLLLVRTVWARRPGANEIQLTGIDPERRWLLASVAFGFAFWAQASGNGRYLMPLEIVVGPVLVWLVYAMVQRPILRVLFLSMVLVGQSIGVAIGADERWQPTDWGGEWLPVEGGEFLRDEPRLYLSVTNQSASFLALIAHPQSSLVNVTGQSPLTLQGPGGVRLRRLLAAHEGHIALVFPFGQASYYAARPTDQLMSDLDWARMSSHVWHLGLAGVRADCRFLVVRGLRLVDMWDDPSSVWTGAEKASLHFAVCPVIARAPEAGELDEWARATAVLDRLEAACPEAFRPHGTPVIRDGQGWMRFYTDTDRYLSWDGRHFNTASHLSVPLRWSAGSPDAAPVPPAGCPAPRWTRRVGP